MIDKNKKIQCNGCKMCKEVCPKQAITYETDKEGFWYPKVDYTKCVSCELCLKKCPNISHKASTKNAPDVKAVWSVDDTIRLSSTSGGAFYEFAKYIIEHGGYVVGCVYSNDFKSAKQIMIHSMEELPQLMVSKYLQSDTEGIYPQVKEKLQTGAKVLFVGAPCHIAALDSYLGKEYDNLILCDFLCRGANSPKAHRKYVEYLEEKYGARMISLRSKDKRNGWEHFGQSAVFANGKEYFADRQTDLRIVAYHFGNLMMRQSCNECQFKRIPRDSDITLGDFWGIKSDEVNNIDNGISLVMLNSEKGKRLFESIGDRIEYINKTLEDAERGNVAIHTSAPKGKNRDVFLRRLDDMPFDKLVAKYREKNSLIKKIIRRIKALIKKVRDF